MHNYGTWRAKSGGSALRSEKNVDRGLKPLGAACSIIYVIATKPGWCVGAVSGKPAVGINLMTARARTGDDDVGRTADTHDGAEVVKSTSVGYPI